MGSWLTLGIGEILLLYVNQGQGTWGMGMELFCICYFDGTGVVKVTLRLSWVDLVGGCPPWSGFICVKGLGCIKVWWNPCRWSVLIGMSDRLWAEGTGLGSGMDYFISVRLLFKAGLHNHHPVTDNCHNGCWSCCRVFVQALWAWSALLHVAVWLGQGF